MPKSPFTLSFDQLPELLPIFPLSGAVVLPGGSLPLNIFEPRYLNMVQDAMRSNQLIGMIQPKDNSSKPSLFDVGCAGRIQRYEEVAGGRLEILIAGLCRFNIKEELDSARGYRIVKANWANYRLDIERSNEETTVDRQPLLRALHRYFEINKLDTDWDKIEEIDQAMLVNNLLTFLPLTKEDKQLLVETASPNDRIKSFIAILDRQKSDGNETRH